MKKIYFILSLAVVALLSSCSEDFNEHNFPGYKDASNPTNVATYSYTLTDADYTTIGDAVKKIVNDSITTFKTALKTANHTDSITLNASITKLNNRLKTEVPFINATYVASNKILNSTLKGTDYLPILLNSKYIYADKGSIIKIKYDNVDNGDTLSIPATSRFTLAAADYIQMGTGTNQPGQYKNMSSSIASIITYLNTYLKTKCPYAVSGDVKSVGYIYYDSNKTTKKQYRILTFDGQNWAGAAEQYVFNGTEWVFDPTISVVMKKGKNATDDYMLLVTYVKNTYAAATPSLVNSFGDSEYYYGASANYGNISLRDADRLKDPTYLALATTEAKAAFLAQRTQEGLGIYLQLKFPTAQPQVNGVDVYAFVTAAIYDGTTTINYTYKYKCIGTNPSKWKYDSRQ